MLFVYICICYWILEYTNALQQGYGMHRRVQRSRKRVIHHTQYSTADGTNKSILIFIFHVFCRLLILMKSCKTKKMKVIRSQQWYSYKIICKSLFIQKYKIGHLLLIKKNSGPCEKKEEQKHPHPTSKKQKPKILPKIKKKQSIAQVLNLTVFIPLFIIKLAL